MIAFSITDTKFFMNSLLKEDTFDSFEVRGVELYSFTKFNMSGALNTSDLTDSDIKRNYCTWQELRPYVFNIIKGNAKPKYIKIIFSLSVEESLKLHSNSAALYLNMNFSDDAITFTTGTAQKNFDLDKSLDHVWEDYVIKFFKAKGFVSTLI